MKAFFLLLALVLLLMVTPFVRADSSSDSSDSDDSIRDWLKERRKNRRKEKSGKDLKELELSIKDNDGNSKSLKLGKLRALTPEIKTYKMEKGKLVEEAPSTSGVQYSVFADVSNGSDSILLMACDEVNCDAAGSFYHGNERYILESATEEPFLNKGKSIKESKQKTMYDERAIGLSSDGTPLPVPLTARKRRDLALDSKMKESMLKRKRRQLNVNNVVELAVVIDASEYQYWYNRASNDSVAAKMAIELYVILLTNMMDMRFDDLYVQTGDMDINFMVNTIIYAETDEDSPWSISNTVTSDGREFLNVNKALDDLTVWAWQSRGDFPAIDHIIGITKRNLASYKDSAWVPDVIGVAWTGGMCTPGYSVSLIEDPGIGLIDFAAAHEIAHNLGANHDGASGCSDKDFFIMGEYGGSPAEGLSATGREDHPFRFSSCTVDSIHNYVLGLGTGNCMQTSTFNQTKYDSYKAFLSPGTFLPIDIQCELQYGEYSRRCYLLEPTICSDGAWCWNPGDPGYCYTMYVRDGSLCGSNMRCQKGLCVNSTDVVPTCPPPTGEPAQGGKVVVVPVDVTAVPDQLITTVTPYQSTAQNLYATTVAQQDMLTPPDTSEQLFC